MLCAFIAINNIIPKYKIQFSQYNRVIGFSFRQWRISHLSLTVLIYHMDAVVYTHSCGWLIVVYSGCSTSVNPCNNLSINSPLYFCNSFTSLELIYVYYSNYNTQGICLYVDTIIIVRYNWLGYNWWVEDGLRMSFINIGGQTTIDERRMNVCRCG